MLSIDLIKKEYFRIKKLCEKQYGEKLDSLTQYEYNKNCQEGYTPYQIRKQLGLTYNKFKTEIGETLSSTQSKPFREKVSYNRIYCKRGEGSMIFARDCIPGCNDACNDCENPQEGNIKASPSLTPQEDWEQCTVGIHGSSHGKTIEGTINFD